MIKRLYPGQDLKWDKAVITGTREEKHDSLKLINDKGVCRTAPATPGLLNTVIHKAGML